jgi:hypothetical protein
VAQVAQPAQLRAMWFQECVNRRATETGRPRLTAAQGDRLYDLWRRTGWAPISGEIEDVLRPVESAASSTVREELRALQRLGLEAWLAQTAVRHGVTIGEMRSILDGKIARWTSAGQPLPEADYLAEGLAYAIWQYEELARRVAKNWGLW